MRAMVVFESMFGNTQTIANSIAEGISSRMQVDVVEVSKAPHAIENEWDLIVAGGPTHAFGMSRPSTRKSVGDKYGRAPISSGIGLREWVDGLEIGTPKPVIAIFDTRFRKPRWLVGSAARRAARRFRRRKVPMVAPPESFFVTSTTGPLAEGEPERARRWGVSLAKASQALRTSAASWRSGC